MSIVNVTRKPCKCPNCGGKLIPIIYGEPTLETFEKAERGEVKLGGCCIHAEGDPQWACSECDTEFMKK